MGVWIGDNKIIQIFHFDFPKVISNSLIHEIDFVIKQNEFLAKHTIKNKARQLWSKYKHENNIHEHGKQ